MFRNDTIAAISTGMTNSGIGVVRISGEDAVKVADRIFRKPNGRKLSEEKTFTIHYGHIYDENELIDEVLVMLMRGPRSYTAEDTVEIDCHGGVLVMRKILETVVKKRGEASRAGRVHKAGIFEWQNRSVPGRGGYRCDQCKKRLRTEKLCKSAERGNVQKGEGAERKTHL